MDSLTQIVLGAAVGETVAGRRLGNRALLWGGIGGTIPDLDVVANGFLTPLQALVTHRGFSHSILFAIMGAFVFGWLIHAMYKSPYHRHIAFIGWFALPAGVLFFFSRIFEAARLEVWSTGLLLLTLLGIGYVLFRKYFKSEITPPDVSLVTWRWLMFWTIVTHPLLDCFTTYGTQLFQPFSDYRVAFNTIAVADPFYTVPFLLCVIGASWLKRENQLRRKLIWTGLTVSSIYMAFCVFNKSRVDAHWVKTLASQDISYSRYMSSPSILSNFLWTMVAETEDGFVTGQYSIFDKSPTKTEYIPRNSTSRDINLDDPSIERLRWFSNDYYSVINHSDGIQFNDLRFGSQLSKDGGKHYIFNFVLRPSADQLFEMIGSNGGPPPGEEQEMISQLYTRIKGI